MKTTLLLFSLLLPLTNLFGEEVKILVCGKNPQKAEFSVENQKSTLRFLNVDSTGRTSITKLEQDILSSGNLNGETRKKITDYMYLEQSEVSPPVVYGYVVGDKKTKQIDSMYVIVQSAEDNIYLLHQTKSGIQKIGTEEDCIDTEE